MTSIPTSAAPARVCSPTPARCSAFTPMATARRMAAAPTSAGPPPVSSRSRRTCSRATSPIASRGRVSCGWRRRASLTAGQPDSTTADRRARSARPWAIRRRMAVVRDRPPPALECRLTYVAADDRYATMSYRRCGRSGLKLPAVSLGLWHNFGDGRSPGLNSAILRRAVHLGVTHFDLANNYGPPYGSAETNFGTAFAADFRPYRDELIISTKAGYDMWPGPYGEWGSRKYLLASLDQSLRRMGLSYVDIFYSHRFDPETPLEETMGAL